MKVGRELVHSVLRVVGPVSVAAGLGFLAYGAYRLTLTDPFDRFKPSATDSSLPAIELRGVTLRHYSKGKLSGQAEVQRVTIRQDRQVLDFEGITDGRYRNDKREFKFDAKTATYATVARRLEVTSGANIVNADLNLKVPSFTYEGHRSRLLVPGQIKGRLYEGEVLASSLAYNLESGNFILGPAKWVGLASMPQQDGEPPAQRSKWTIVTKGTSRRVGDVEVWNDADATDGEVIIKAPKVERNVKTDVVTATGRVLYFGKEANVVCDKVTIYRKEKRAVLEGNVTMLLKPKDQQKLEVAEIPPFRPMVPETVAGGRPPAPSNDDQRKREEELRSPKSVRKYPISVLATRIEYWYAKGNRHAVITGSPQARQDLPDGSWRHIWTNKALYDGEAETLRMVSSDGKRDTRIKTSVGDDLTAIWFQVSTKDDDESWEAEGVQGELFPDDSELPDRNKNKNPPGLQGPIGLRPRP